MKIWIDLANSPQVLFFVPIIRELERRGHSLTITSRDFAQTIQLADHYGLHHLPIGTHGGKKLLGIGVKILNRAWQLSRFAAPCKFDLAVSHNSYAQVLAAFALRMPAITTMDYEHQPANHLCFRLARKVIVPEYFPEPALRRFGARSEKITRYCGLKEQMYLTGFVPKRDFLEASSIPIARVIVAMRPPGSWGLYHHFENPLFDTVLDYVAGHPEAYVVFLPRIPSQGSAVSAKGYPNVWVPSRALDGPNLLYYADLAISGGGTMNREAAVLGTPAYSVFKGKVPAVDQYLIGQGRMKYVSDIGDICGIRIRKKSQHAPMRDGRLVQEIADAILDS